MVLGLLKSPFGRSLVIVGCLTMLLLAAKPALEAAYADRVAELAHHGKAKPHRRGQRAIPPPPRRALPAPPPAQAGRADIPPAYLALYRAAGGTCAGLDWSVLAGIGKVETSHGRSTLPGVHSGANFAGAMGPMQFLGGTWAVYGRGGNVYDPRDAIPAAARLLCAAGIGASPPDRCPGVLGTPGQHQAVFAYNHACWYVQQVLTFARSYRGG